MPRYTGIHANLKHAYATTPTIFYSSLRTSMPATTLHSYCLRHGGDAASPTYIQRRTQRCVSNVTTCMYPFPQAQRPSPSPDHDHGHDVAFSITCIAAVTVYAFPFPFPFPLSHFAISLILFSFGWGLWQRSGRTWRLEAGARHKKDGSTYGGCLALGVSMHATWIRDVDGQATQAQAQRVQDRYANRYGVM
jgi:hypothetical protein